MDISSLGLGDENLKIATQVLDYQPFIISDQIQTGVAYSFLHSDDSRISPPLVFFREDWEGEWDKITDANGRLRSMYDDLVDEVATRFPGGSLLDVGCNNGYIPVAAELRGMRACAGVDRAARHADAVEFLNSIYGTSVEFMHQPYESRNHGAAIDGQFDVVVANAILCHLPDPLHFLSFLGSRAKHAILFWGALVESDMLGIFLRPYHENLGAEREFPHCFNDDTRLTVALFEHSMKLMGFSQILEIPYRDTWLPRSKYQNLGVSIEEQVKGVSPHYAYLCLR